MARRKRRLADLKQCKKHNKRIQKEEYAAFIRFKGKEHPENVNNWRKMHGLPMFSKRTWPFRKYVVILDELF